MIARVNELIDAYDSGMYAFDDVLNRILSLASHHPVDEIVASLPEPWQGDFLSWARRMFDNAIPLDQFVVISQGATSDEDLRPITLIREWFRLQDRPAEPP